MDSKGYAYVLEDEKIVEYMKLTAEEKLAWLHEINSFNRLVLSKEQQELREKLRTGEATL